MSKYCFLYYLQIDKKLKDKKYQKIYNSKNQIKINFKHKKSNYKIWCVSIVSYFRSYIFKKLQINNFKHEKSNYFQFFQKII